MKRSPLKRRTRLRPKAEKPSRYDAEIWHGPGGPEDSHREFVRSRGCLLSRSECGGPIEVHHVKTRATGGGFLDLVPLCRAHHTGGPWPAFPVHQGRETFEKWYGVDLEAQAKRLVAEHYPEDVRQ